VSLSGVSSIQLLDRLAHRLVLSRAAQAPQDGAQQTAVDGASGLGAGRPRRQVQVRSLAMVPAAYCALWSPAWR